MTVIPLLIFSLALIYGVEPKRLELEVSWEYRSSVGIVVDDSVEDGIFTVVSNSEELVSRQGVLHLQNSSGVISESDIGYQPDKLIAYNLDEDGDKTIHIVTTLNSGEQSRLSYCTYYYTYERLVYEELHCLPYRRYNPPRDFVASVDISDNNQVSVHAVYHDGAGQLTRYDVKHNHLIGSVPLPQNCSCVNSSCLLPVDEPRGRVIVQCDNGSAYLYELYTENFIVLPPEVKQIATSKHRGMVLAAQPTEGLYQDIMVETNMVTDWQNASALPLEGSLASSSNPVTIQAVAIVSVNETSQLEVCFVLRNDKILYFELDELGVHPDIKSLSLPSNIIPIAIRGYYDSSVVVECTYGNGTSVLVVIKARVLQPENPTETSHTTESNDTLPSTEPTFPPSHDSTISTSPCETEMPASTADVDDNQVNSTSTSDCSDNFHPKSFIIGVTIGFAPAVVIVTLVVILCRLKKSTGYDIRNDPQTK